MADNKYMCDYARLGTSSCKKCKQKLAKGGLRLAKVVNNPFTDEGGEMKMYHHANCLFETFIRARATTKIIEEPEDIHGFDELNDEDKDMLKKLIKGEISLSSHKMHVACAGLILILHSADDRGRYFVTMSLIGWAQA